MGRPRLYATSVERKAAWRRRQGMAVRPSYPSAAAKQAAYRARQRQDVGLAPGVCHNPAGTSDASTGGSVLGAVRVSDDVEPGCGHATASPGGPPPRAPGRRERHFYGGPRRACASIAEALQRLAHVRAIRGA